LEKKNVLIAVLLIFLIASGVSLILLASNYRRDVNHHSIITLIIGTGVSPYTLDPVNAWDSASYDTIDQVCEGLFTYDLTDPALTRVNKLAESYWYATPTSIQVKLREGILFHDGTPFNAAAVKWNLDRLNYMINASGEDEREYPFNTVLPGNSPIALPTSLFYFPDGITPIIKNVTAVGTYNITITLNDAFAPFLDLLCHEAASMLSPSSTPTTRFIELYEDLVGTGPFEFDSFTAGVDIRFSRWDYYWRTPAYCSNLIFAIIPSSTTRNNAMLSHEIDYLAGAIASLIPTFEADPTITVKQFTDDTGIPGLSYYYLGFNNMKISLPWRKAMSFAINYTYIIENMQGNSVLRANSPISPAYGAAYNASANAADYDLLIARQTLIDAGLAPGLPATGDPTNPQWLAANLATFTYSYNWDNQFRSDLYVALENWMDLIGVTILDDGLTWDDFLKKLFINYDKLDLYWGGWAPDYLDPFNMLNPLFNPLSYSNIAQVNDTTLTDLMVLALTIVDDTARNNIYKHIQWYLEESLYPHAFGYHLKIVFVHSAYLGGVTYNAMGKFEAYTIWNEYYY
jgi:ABC-type transport system substrate-binding protein